MKYTMDNSHWTEYVARLWKETLKHVKYVGVVRGLFRRPHSLALRSIAVITIFSLMITIALLKSASSHRSQYIKIQTPVTYPADAKIYRPSVAEINKEFEDMGFDLPEYDVTDPIPLMKWNSVLGKYADDNGVILLSLIDSGFMDMAMNFYETSLQKFSISNYLFVASDAKACLFFKENNLSVNCYVYQNDTDAAKASEYNTPEFKRKMNIRTYMILDALKLGFTVFHSDIDIVFLRNPLEAVLDECRGYCDIALQWDHSAHNAGFLLAKPRSSTKLLYKFMKYLAHKYPVLDDQTDLNRALDFLKQKERIDIATLNHFRYMNGWEFFERGQRVFAGDNPWPLSSMTVHNNWIVSKDAKTYRFKEMQLWQYDGNGYYSNPKRKYLTYDNILELADDENTTLQLEHEALANALAIGKILNRTVVLPKFSCPEKDKILWTHCGLNSHFRLQEFNAEFQDAYREHTFLTHPKVPLEVKYSITEPYIIRSGEPAKFLINFANTASIKLENINENQGTDRITKFTPIEEYGGSELEILKWFGRSQKAVLRFHNLYGAFDKFTNTDDTELFNDKISKAFIKGVYRQHKGKS